MGSKIVQNSNEILSQTVGCAPLSVKDDSIPFLSVASASKRLPPAKDLEEHIAFMQSKLESLLHNTFQSKKETSLKQLINEELPLIECSLDEKSGRSLTLSLLCEEQERISLSEFLLDLFCFHLIPGRDSYPSSFHHLVFDPGKEYRPILYLAHLQFTIHNEREYDLIESNLNFVTEALEKGLKNPLYAQSILNKKLTIPDRKSKGIHTHINNVIKKWPSIADAVLSEAGIFQALSSELFREHRITKQLARIICSFAILRQAIKETSTFSETPLLRFRLFPTTLHFTFGEKRTLGLCVAINQLGEYQLFTERCIVQTVRTRFPEARAVKGSFLTYQNPQDRAHVFYIELEKKKGEPFTLEEMKQMKEHLQQNLETGIEEVVPSVFMTRNEEEVMKNIIALREQLNSGSDLPQVILSFEGQTLTHLTFVITLVRVAKERETPLQEKLASLEEEWHYLPERTRNISQEQDEVVKEAHVFRLRLKKSSIFTRSDSSINLNLARQHVLEFLIKKLGPVRDYTGGVVLMQNTLFAKFREKYEPIAKKYPNILDDFFYGFTPAEIQVTLPIDAIETLFEHYLYLLNERSKDERIPIKKSETKEAAFAVLKLTPSLADYLEEKVSSHQAYHAFLVTTKIRRQGQVFLGYIYQTKSAKERKLFFEQLQTILFSYAQQEQEKQTLHLTTEIFPTSLDPRISLLPTTNYIFKLLFDGLMRIDSDGQPRCAVAKSYTLSEDRKTYTFSLRETQWSNGDSVTAEDFAYGWKKVLSPTFNTPFAYFFNAIKNAKQAKQGKVPSSSVGVYAKDAKTLIVELEYPLPHFLHYTALNLFYPINQTIDKQHPDWPYRTKQEYVCNGPMTLDEATAGKELQLIKNPLYWDHKQVHLERCQITFGSTNNIINRFEREELDWLGAPFISWKRRFFAAKGELRILSRSGGCWIALNTQSHPFNSKKFRQAFRYALNLEKLVDQLPTKVKPAYTPLPDIYSELAQIPSKSNREDARNLLKEALEEMQINKEELPKLTILHASETIKKRGKLLYKITEQIRETLGIDLSVEIIPWQDAYKKQLRDKFHLVVLGWWFLSPTPFYLLDAFESLEEKNVYRWSNERYRKAIRKAKKENDPTKQTKRIAEIERILFDEVPIIPLYHEEEYYIKNDRLKGVSTDHTIGSVDFKTAYFESKKTDISQLVRWV